MNIAAQIRFIRLAKRETRAQVAEGAGLSLSYLRDIECGRTNPSIEALEKIAEYHGLALYVGFVVGVPDTVKVSFSDLNALIRGTGRMKGNK